VEKELRRALDAARAAPPAEADFRASRPLPDRCARADAEVRLPAAGSEGLTLLEALRETLRARLADDPRVTLYGQDLEDPKGDVFGVTRGLSTEFGGRVVNAPLSEATIAGVSIGRALAGGRPVAFLQFADFFPVAFNQIHSELAALHWRSAGQWDAPVLLLAVTGGYRPGLGPYHAQTPEAYMLHTPGLDVFMPSTAADAAGLLNSAFESGRPSVFFYPKNLLNERSALADADVRRQFVPIGHARVARAGTDVTLVGWGNTVPLCEQAAQALETAGVQAEVLDLRTLSPWDRQRVTASAARTGRLIVVHEDTRTCGLGAEILAAVAESAPSPVRMARVTTPDCWLPFQFDGQLQALPSFRRVLECAAEMLELDLRWEKAEADPEGEFTLRAAGSSPSDEVVRILAWQVTEGQTVREGDALASAEADKAAFDMSVPVGGKVEKLLVAEGAPVRVGEPIARIRLPKGASLPAAFCSREEKPVLTRRAARPVRTGPDAGTRSETPVTLSSIASVLGSRVLKNDDLLRRFPEWDAADIVQRTGIEKRYWIGEGESVLSLAVRAARECLDREGLAISELSALICSTGTPMSMTPSLACRVLKELSPDRGEVMVQAWDINAACSGYLYALQSAYDFLTNRPDARVLVLTAETLSPVLDPADPGTLFLFGDGATASLVSREPKRPTAQARVHRPVLSAKGEDASILYVPFPGNREFLQMSGQQVFRVAVRKMIDMLEQACQQANLSVDDLAMVVPHQANTRIIEAIREKIKLPPERMFNHIREYANTSSNTIPLALQTVLAQQPAGARIGLCAFGGGFTFGAGILERL
jgi:2-oxoisovalerate dehydrogenase E1 component